MTCTRCESGLKVTYTAKFGRKYSKDTKILFKYWTNICAECKDEVEHHALFFGITFTPVKKEENKNE